MTAAARITDAGPIATLEEFAECAAFYSWCWETGILEKIKAVDAAQRHAELWGLVDAFGHDEVQRILAWAFAPAAGAASC